MKGHLEVELKEEVICPPFQVHKVCKEAVARTESGRGACHKAHGRSRAGMAGVGVCR